MSQVSSTSSAFTPPDRTRAVLLCSGLLGFALGALFADWQVVVETGQVLAGLVRYPADNPFFIYHVKLWSLLNQACGMFLRMGVSEIALSVAVSGLLGLLSFQALSLVVYVIGRDAVLAIGAAFVIFLGGATNYGVVYPVALLATEHTYGVVGLAWVVLVAALFGAGRPKAGGFLLGLAPAVHPSLGVWLGVLMAIAGLWNWRATWALVRPGVIYFLVGGALTGLSLAMQLAHMPALPHADPAESLRYLDAFVGFWDGHRAPVKFTRAGIGLNLVALALSLVALRRWKTRSPGLSGWSPGLSGWSPGSSDPGDFQPAKFLLKFIAVTAVASLGLAFVSHLPPSAVPAPLLVLMPSRLLNINVLLCGALVFGVLGRRGGLPGHAAFIAVALVLLFSGRSLLWHFFEPDGSRAVAKLGLAPFAVLLVLGMAGLGGLVYWHATRHAGSKDPASIRPRDPASIRPRDPASIRPRDPASIRPPDPASIRPPDPASIRPRDPASIRPRDTTAIWRAAVIALMSAATGLSFLTAIERDRADRARILRDRTNEPVFAAAARTTGVLLTGGDLHLMQLRTRRPVLLDGGGLDALPYALEAAPAMDRILRDVYGVDLFHPPEEARDEGKVPLEANRAVWERYTLARWQQIGRTYGVTQVMAPGEWQLQLPMLAAGQGIVLYTIPR